VTAAMFNPVKGTLGSPQGMLVSWAATSSNATPHSYESPPLHSVGLSL